MAELLQKVQETVRTLENNGVNAALQHYPGLGHGPMFNASFAVHCWISVANRQAKTTLPLTRRQIMPASGGHNPSKRGRHTGIISPTRFVIGICPFGGAIDLFIEDIADTDIKTQVLIDIVINVSADQ